jgi:hypothetical protein
MDIAILTKNFKTGEVILQNLIEVSAKSGGEGFATAEFVDCLAALCYACSCAYYCTGYISHTSANQHHLYLAPTIEGSPMVSLLWDQPSAATHSIMNEFSLVDLNVAALIRQLSLAPQYEPHTRKILLQSCLDEATLHYRQAILNDLLAHPAFTEQLVSILAAITDLEAYLNQPQWRESPLQQVAWRLSELDHYVQCAVQLAELLIHNRSQLQSSGWQRLTAALEELTQDPTFVQLRAELPQLIPQIRGIVSITIGVNLDDELRPTTAILLAANNQRFTETSFMARLFGRKNPEAQEGIGTLHNTRQLNSGGMQVELRKMDSPFMPPLFRDLTLLLEDTSRPIVQALKKYTQIEAQVLVALRQELAFYLGAVQLIQRLRAAQVPLVMPQIAPREARRTELRGLYNVNLALQLLPRHPNLHEVMVQNEALFDDEGRIFILTGPNQGGKTTYTQAVGLAQLLFQAGLPVPAESAHLSLVDGIFTHFATEERPDLEAGRLGEEARRLQGIFQRATRYSLILLNESLASTSVTESLFIAKEIVQVLRLMGTRAIFATHLHDLALACAELNAAVAGDSQIVSLISVAQIEDTLSGQVVRRTYHIVRGTPSGRSYAVELAAKYGISYEQLVTLLKQRAVIT